MLLLLTAACLSNPAALLEANRRAMTGGSSPATIISRYATSGQGLTGNATSIVDQASGRFIVEEREGPSSGTNGFDGIHAWMRDLSGYATPQDAGRPSALARNEAYRVANRWWRRDHGGAQLQSLGCNAIRVTPPGGVAFDAWFDPATHLLARIQEQRTFGTVVDTVYGGYERRGGGLAPTRITVSSGGDPSTAVEWRLTERSEGAARAASFYARPTRQPHDWSINPGGEVTMPFRLLNNHVIVDVKVNGRGPFPFLVDTGGHDIVTPETAHRIGLDAVGAATSGGGGEATTTNGYARVQEIDLGGARLTDQTVVTLDFSPVAVEGIQLGGMIGVEFFERFVVTLDYGARTMTIIDATRFHARGTPAGQPVPFLFYEHMPQLAGSFGGRPARYNIDTGSRADVSMTSPFVARARLHQAFPGGITITDGWGVGGPVHSFVTRAPALTLGSVRVPRPIVSLSSARRGAFSDPGYDGNIGSGLLKRFSVTFDYSRQRLYFAPASRVDADTGRADRTGMWINLGTGGLEIMDVLAGGPAEQAGLRTHDLVTAIGGVAFDARSLSDWRSTLKTLPVSDAIDIAYTRNGRAAHASLRPGDLVP